MFQIVELVDVVRIPPSHFGNPLDDVATDILKMKYESTMTPELGYIIMLSEINTDSIGKIIPGDGARYHKVKFSALTFFPKLQEIMEGEVVEITEFGAFIRLGPADALLHLSQIMDDYLTSDTRQGMIIASQSKRTLKVGSKVRVRITAVSLGRGTAMGKIGVTCRQPLLGAMEWIEEDLDKMEGKKVDEKKVEAKPPEASRK